MKIEDYLHLYLGCQISRCNNVEGTVTLTAEVLNNFLNVKGGIYFTIKPILRPLSNMTDEEISFWWETVCQPNEQMDKAEWKEDGEFAERHWTLWSKDNRVARHGYTIGIWHSFTSNQFLYLLSKYFDIFGLIESGLAIDATKQLSH